MIVAGGDKVGTKILALGHLLNDIVVKIDTKFMVAGPSNQGRVGNVERVEAYCLRNNTDQFGCRSLIEIAGAIEVVWRRYVGERRLYIDARDC